MRYTRTREQLNLKVDRHIALLSPLGFDCCHEFRFSHAYAEGFYDTSALSDDFLIAHAIEWIYERGIKEGIERHQQKLKELIGIDDSTL